MARRTNADRYGAANAAFLRTKRGKQTLAFARERGATERGQRAALTNDRKRAGYIPPAQRKAFFSRKTTVKGREVYKTTDWHSHEENLGQMPAELRAGALWRAIENNVRADDTLLVFVFGIPYLGYGKEEEQQWRGLRGADARRALTRQMLEEAINTVVEDGVFTKYRIQWRSG